MNENSKYRKKAEEIVKKDNIHENLANRKDFKEIAYELAVHQTELEMQNNELQEAQRELSVSRDKYYSLYDFSPVAYFTIDEKGIILEANKTASDLLKIDKNYLVKKPFMIYLDSAFQELFINHRNLVLESKKKQSILLKIKRRDKTYFHAKMVSIYKENYENKCLILSSLTDIESLIKLNEELTEAKIKAEEANTIKSEFVSNISHELKTPMNGIIGFSKLLLESDLSEEQKSYTEMVYKSAQHLMEIINDLLDINSIESNSIKINNFSIKIKDLLQDTFNVLKLEAVKKNLDYTIDIQNDIPDNLIGDQKIIKQILINLLSNAIKFTNDKGKVSFNCNIDKDLEDEIYLKLKIKDNGIGIADNKKHLLFKNFSQIDTSVSKRYPGTGLGLSITKKLIEKIGGNISFESYENRGTEFTVIIPLIKTS